MQLDGEGENIDDRVIQVRDGYIWCDGQIVAKMCAEHYRVAQTIIEDFIRQIET